MEWLFTILTKYAVKYGRKLWEICSLIKEKRKKCEKIQVIDKDVTGKGGKIVKDQLCDMEILPFPLEH